MKCVPTKPCLRCTRVPCPDDCNDVHCTAWQSWFSAAWEQTRSAPRRQMDRVQMVPLGVPIGGRFYAPPHLVREYREKNPCHCCAIKPLCTEPCKVRKQWECQGGCQ